MENTIESLFKEVENLLTSNPKELSNVDISMIIMVITNLETRKVMEIENLSEKENILLDDFYESNIWKYWENINDGKEVEGAKQGIKKVSLNIINSDFLDKVANGENIDKILGSEEEQSISMIEKFLIDRAKIV